MVYGRDVRMTDFSEEASYDEEPTILETKTKVILRKLGRYKKSGA